MKLKKEETRNNKTKHFYKVLKAKVMTKRQTFISAMNTQKTNKVVHEPRVSHDFAINKTCKITIVGTISHHLTS